MFTGIIEEVGKVEEIRPSGESHVLRIKAGRVLEGTQIGDSICVNGVCLTVTGISNQEGSGTFTVDVSKETLDRTTFRALGTGDSLNLERSLTLSSRLGGHMVSGHVDGVGTVEEVLQEGENAVYRFGASPEILNFMIEKGSIAVEGISLTAYQVTDSGFTVTIIPHTLAQTNLGSKGVGSPVNLECDMIGKYVKKFLTDSGITSSNKRITDEFLSEHGF